MNPSTAQAAVIVDELIRGGVRDVVLCPGSRNAPLSFALFDADDAGRLRLHVRIDERSAGFLAVGLAVASGRPSVVVMTSGTAVANLGPAVLEANYARVPLIVLSANRPYELLGTGANQTIEQFGLFGSQVRAAISLGLAEPEPERQNSAWRSAVCRVLAEAAGTRSALAGPVQFDVPLREPLVPDAPSDGVPSDVPAGRPDGAPWTRVADARVEVDVPVDLSLDTVVIAGHGSGRLPELDGLPTIAEPTARQRGIATNPLALLAVKPQQAIITGRPTLHRPVSALLADPQVNVIAITTGPRWPDVSGNIAATGSKPLLSGAPRADWLEQCAAADTRADASVAAQLKAHPAATGLHVAHAVVRALRAGDQLVLGASNPVRDLSLVGAIPAGVVVRSNRGVAGIDGVVSTAIGAGLAHEGRTVALLGDLTFLHDSNGLMLGPDEPRPRELTIVVANDEGGGIFEVLEQGAPRHRRAFERVFGTPHRTDIAALCAAHRIPHTRVPVAGLAAALDGEPAGIRVVEVATDRSGLRELHAAIRAGL